MVSEEPPARVETALLAAFRAQTIVIPAPGRALALGGLEVGGCGGNFDPDFSDGRLLAIDWFGTGHNAKNEPSCQRPAPRHAVKTGEPPLSHDPDCGPDLIEQPQNELKRRRTHGVCEQPG